jgi:hypothetical protein
MVRVTTVVAFDRAAFSGRVTSVVAVTVWSRRLPQGAEAVASLEDMVRIAMSGAQVMCVVKVAERKIDSVSETKSVLNQTMTTLVSFVLGEYGEWVFGCSMRIALECVRCLMQPPPSPRQKE